MRIQLLTIVSILALATAGCAADATETEVESSSTAVSAAEARGKATLDVTWNYLDRIGRGVVNDVDVAGQIKIELVGAPLPVAGSTKPLQTAILTLTLPEFDDPNQNTARRFFIHYEVDARADGTTLYDARPYSKASIVDADVPNAAAKFAATYDAATQRAKEYFSFSGDINFASFGFQADAAGHLKPQASFWIGTSPRRKSDFAWHNAVVSLKD